MIIGVDFDDGIFAGNESLALFHNAKYGTSYKREDVRHWHLRYVWGCEPEEEKRRVNEWLDSEWHEETLPVPGAIASIFRLEAHHELHIITARPSRTRDSVERFLSKYFPGCFESIHFTGDEAMGEGIKVDICKHLGVELHTDDSPGQAIALSKAGIEVLLLDTPWNQGVVGDNISRVLNWKEVEAEVSARLTPASR